MAEWPEGDVRIDGMRFHYYRTGGESKPVLLLLHGVTDNGLCWSRVASELQDRYDVVMTDARGHGKSDGIETGFSVPILARDAAAIITALELERPYVFGHSMGAITAAMLAAEHPGLVRALVLEDPPIGDEIRPRRTNAGAGDQWLEELLQSRSRPRAERLALARSQNPGWTEEETVPWSDAKTQFDVEVLRQVAVLRRIPWRQVLGGIECPMALVTGDPALGAIVTPAVSEEVLRICPKSLIINVPGAGHSVHRDRFRETMEQVQHFLRQH